MANTDIIRFGTDGWRGIIARDFTFANVGKVTRGVCEYLKGRQASKKDRPRVVIGYDSRFLSAQFARHAATVLAGEGIQAVVSSGEIPTPVLSSAVVSLKADLGVMITASHNPYYYNGYKIKAPFGGSAPMDMVADIQQAVNRAPAEGPQSRSDAAFETKDFIPAYRQRIFALIDRQAAANQGLRLLVDPMYGAGRGLFKQMVAELKPQEVEEIHGEANPGFGNINPEPIGDNLAEAAQAVQARGMDMAICLDGDADRIGALDSRGGYISSHHIFAVLLWHLAQDKKLKGRVVKTVSTSSVVDRICKKYSLALTTTPIGFKYIAEQILKGDVIMGGEESGGLWCYGYIPERDGMLMGLKLVEICARQGKPIHRILESLYAEFGPFTYSRVDYQITETQKEKLIGVLEAGVPAPLQDLGIKEVVKIDGYKYITPEGSWVMIRPSGTEAVVRVYAESDSEAKRDRLLGLGKKVIDGIMA